MNLIQFQQLKKEDQRALLFSCCGSTAWVNRMIQGLPYHSIEKLVEASDQIWSDVSRDDALEAFSHHPKIGDLDAIRKKYASTQHLTIGEQSQVAEAPPEILQELIEKNYIYEKRFGYIFIVCATGKRAAEMLTLLESRLNNENEAELRIAMEEQNKITHIRLHKLFS